MTCEFCIDCISVLVLRNAYIHDHDGCATRAKTDSAGVFLNSSNSLDQSGTNLC